MNRSKPLKNILFTVLTLMILAGIPVTADSDHEEEQDDLDTFFARPEIQPELTILFSTINKRYQNVKPIFEKSCFDCHSDKTIYPWYHKLPVIKGMLNDHIKKGRRHLGLSNDFPFSGHDNIKEILEHIKEEIEEGEMPLWSYRLMHWGTAIDGTRRDSVFTWIDNSTMMIDDFYDAHMDNTAVPDDAEEEE